MKKTKLILPVMLLTMSSVPFSSFAAAYTTEVTNNISLGDVNISIHEYEYDKNGNEVEYKDEKMIVPGQRIDKIIRINNNANAVWLRAKLEYSDCGSFQGLSDSDIELASSDWIKIGDYFYCTVPINAKTDKDFVKAVNIPTEWDESRSNQIFSIYTTVEAVQEANFTPDFTKSDPWFGTVIESCVHTTYDISTETGDQPFSVVFENGAEGLVKVGDDFFSNWPSLMPGDTVSDTVTIGNNYSRPMTIFFRTETIADDDLIGKVHLTIKNGDKVLYDGAMNGEITKEISLGYISRNETKNLTYTVSIPSNLTNEFALAKTKTKWIFRCFYGSNGGNGGGSGNNGGGNTTPSPGPTPTDTTPTPGPTPTDTTPAPGPIPTITEIIKKIPKLGDTNAAQIFFGASAAGLFLAGVTWKPKKKKERKEAGENA